MGLLMVPVSRPSASSSKVLHTTWSMPSARATGSAWMVRADELSTTVCPRAWWADTISRISGYTRAATCSAYSRSPISSSSASDSPRRYPAARISSRSNCMRPSLYRSEASITPMISPILACPRRTRSLACAVAVKPATRVPSRSKNAPTAAPGGLPAIWPSGSDDRVTPPSCRFSRRAGAERPGGSGRRRAGAERPGDRVSAPSRSPVRRRGRPRPPSRPECGRSGPARPATAAAGWPAASRPGAR